MSTKTTKILYWIFNGLFALAMVFTSIGSITMEPETTMIIRDMLGYPEYIIPVTGWLKIIGCVIILAPVYPRLKEWAYAGLGIDLFLAFYSIGKTMGMNMQTVIMLVIYVALAVTAYFFHVKKQKTDGQAV